MVFTLGGITINIPAQMMLFLGAGIGSVLIMAAIGAIGYVIYRPRLAMKRRMAMIGAAPTTRRVLSDKGEGRRQKRIQEKVRQIEESGKKQQRSNKLRLDLLQAGLDIPVKGFVFISIGITIIVGVISSAFGLPWYIPLLMALAAGLGIPKVVIRFMASGRQKLFTENFADAIDVVVRGIRSGLPVTECLNIIGREFPDPVGNEFRLMVEGQQLGMTLEELMRRGLERIPTQDFKFFSIVLQIQQQTGGNLAETLAALSNVLRGRKKLKDKIKALSSEAKASAYIIGSLPLFVMGMLSFLNPNYLALLFTTDTGHFILAEGLVWGGIGSAVMAKMINFRI